MLTHTPIQVTEGPRGAWVGKTPHSPSRSTLESSSIPVLPVRPDGRGFGARGWRLGGEAEEQLEVAGTGNGRPGEEGGWAGAEAQRSYFGTSGAPARPPQASSEWGR